ncbi:hypothetical protein NUU61_004395 [Penicillium alfredii]|uniref:Endonuclease/exonuclease/phosphatase domain-containing protein n=1 Tax=Penicillium alfredii TaxID=1506179 RepID=A0A9W9FL24_9EURO|nr:uncharacterized protein NUU61_004395 [Penicillium alfredii]KAJ5102173.1 hypothetical protein NUU61_004395 [Penicillium alfredii]
MKLPGELPIRVLSHNVRHVTSAPWKGERPWAERKQLLLNEFEYHTRRCEDTFLCLQEVFHNQLVDILAGLNPDTSPEVLDWAYIGVGRDDGHEAGEYSPIFYRPSAWDLQHWETVWISETPEKPSKGWDATSIRIVTIGMFTHRASGYTVLAMNTHLDNDGSHARFEGARILRAKIREYSEGDFGSRISGTFLAGDLNSAENQEAYSELTAPGGLRDPYKLVDSSRRYGHYNTFTGFGYEDNPPSRIDYILLSEGTMAWKVDGYAVLENRFDDGVHNSDHCAVVVDLTLSS